MLGIVIRCKLHFYVNVHDPFRFMYDLSMYITGMKLLLYDEHGRVLLFGTGRAWVRTLAESQQSLTVNLLAN